MSIHRAAFDSTLATVAKLSGALVAIKVIAHSLGPEGMGQVGQFMSVVAILSVLTSGGISVGMTRYVAEGYHRSESIDSLVQTASWILVICCALVAVVTMIWANAISQFLFRSENYSFTLRVGCVFLLPIGYSALGFAVVNGLSATSALVVIQIGSAIIGAGGLVTAIAFWQEQGAAIGLLWMSACPVVFILRWWLKLNPANFRFFFPRRDNRTALMLLRYTALTLISIFCHNLAQIIIRSWLQESHGWKVVGYWQAMTRMSDAYLQVINVFFVAYLLPRLSRERNTLKTISEIGSMYRFVLPILAVLLIICFFLRDIVIAIFLSPPFYVTRDLFLPQLIGDFFKIVAFIPGYLILARGYMPLLLLTDPLQVSMLLVLSSITVVGYGAIGVCWSYSVTYSIYAAISIFGILAYSKRMKAAR